MKFLFKYAKGNYLLIFLSIIACVTAALFSLLTSLVIGFVIDHVILSEVITNPMIQLISNVTGGSEYVREHFHIVFFLVIGINLILFLALFSRYYLQTKYSENLVEQLRNDLYDHLQRLDYRYHVAAKTGDLVQRCTSDTDVIRRFFAGQLQELVQSISLATIAITILFSINPSLTFFAVILMPLMIYYAFTFFKKIQLVFSKLDESEGELTAYVQEVLSGIRVIKAFNTESVEMKRFDKYNQSFKEYDFELIKVLGKYWSTSDLICLLQITLVAVMGVVYAANQTITLGDFIIFFSYETMIVWPIRQIGRLLSEMGKTKVSIGRLMEILDEPQEDLTSGEEVEILGKIEFQDVHFSYQDDKHIVDGVNLIIEQGETVAILGPTASGKSTLISLLNRLYEPVSGRILIDDIPLSKINKKCLRNQIGLVLQEPFLYSKSIFQNIQLANRQMDKQMIEHAANSARVHDDIVSFDQGYETLVGEKGVTLSGGQKQRIAIARTIINKTPIIIFDDSLSAVDSETDKGIRDALKQLNANTTTIIITQRVNSAMSADKIVILEHGKISAVGTHDELIHQDGLYKRIYEIQSRMVSEEEV